MAIQLREDIPGVCENKECENYRAFELYEVEEVKTENKKDYIECYYCKQKIWLDD